MADPRLVAQGEDTADRVLAWVRASMEANYVPPTLHEIAAGTDLSVAGVRHVLGRLEAAGQLHVVPKVSRGLRLGPRNV